MIANNEAMNLERTALPIVSPASTLLLCLIGAFLIFIPGHEFVFLWSQGVCPGSWIDLFVTFSLLLANWLTFRHWIYPHLQGLRKQTGKRLGWWIIVLFVLQMSGNVLVVKGYLNWYWGQSLQSFMVNGFAPSTLLIGSWFVITYGLPLPIERELASPLQPKGSMAKKIQVTFNGKQRFAPITEIALVERAHDSTVLHLRDGKKYILETSLDLLMQQLPEQDFFRVNRQLILSRNCIIGFDKIENRKLSVLYKGPENHEARTTVSRYKAKDFKWWLELQH